MIKRNPTQEQLTSLLH